MAAVSLRSYRSLAAAIQNSLHGEDNPRPYRSHSHVSKIGHPFQVQARVAEDAAGGGREVELVGHHMQLTALKRCRPPNPLKLINLD